MSSPERLLLELRYDGGPFAGFVRQENAHTVAAELELAIRRMDPEAGALTCSSRTDSGVHALHQIASFVSQKSIESRGWVLGLGQLLPDAVAVTAVSKVDLDFDPRKDPIWKRYRYRVLTSPVPDPFEAGRAFHVLTRLDLSLMREEAKLIVGQHDFAAFRSARDERPVTIRTLHSVQLEEDPRDPRIVHIVVTGDRFLYNMVRIIAGTLVDVGRGRKAPGAMARALASGRREDLGMTAPAAGLYLEHVQLRTLGRDRFPALALLPDEPR